MGFNTPPVETGMENNETIADKGFRERQKNRANGNETRADQGWRERQNSRSNGNETQADQGWRERQNSRSNGNETQADQGWRKRQNGVTVDAVSQVDFSIPNMHNAGGENREKFKDLAENLAKSHERLISQNNNEYQIKKTLSRSGGESVVLLASDQSGKDVAIKIFYLGLDGNSLEARKKVLDYMQTEEGKYYTLAVEDVGYVQLGQGTYYYEVTKFCEGGDLSGDPPYSFDEIVNFVRYMNKVLKSIHDANILHLDIKPENLFRAPDGHIMLGDFGIARLANAGATSSSLGTDGYRSPEANLSVSSKGEAFFYDRPCDYYSLGVTIATLYEGRFIYEGMKPDQMSIYVRDSILPLTRSDDYTEKLENLLHGLVQYDARRRFGYTDVENWLQNYDYAFSAADYDGIWPRGFEFMKETYRDAESLFHAITANEQSWDEASDMLYSKYFEEFFKNFKNGIARAAQLADEQWRNVDRDKGLAIFLKQLFSPGPLVWCGSTFHDLRELAEKMQLTKNPANYGELLSRNIVSYWLDNTSNITVDPNTRQIVGQIEAQAISEPELACYWFGNSFTGRSLCICGRTVTDYDELLAAMFGNQNAFFLQGGYDSLMDRTAGAALYGFLYSLGYKEIIDSSWKNAGNLTEFNKAIVLFNMLDAIAVQEKADASCVRRFFRIYGPLGPYACAKSLVDSGVYYSQNNRMNALLEKIRRFSPASDATVNELHRAFMPLIEEIDEMRTMLQDNPFTISSGIFSTEKIICQNLKGCFAFDIMGTIAPLAFCAILEKGDEQA